MKTKTPIANSLVLLALLLMPSLVHGQVSLAKIIQGIAKPEEAAYGYVPPPSLVVDILPWWPAYNPPTGITAGNIYNSGNQVIQGPSCVSLPANIEGINTRAFMSNSMFCITFPPNIRYIGEAAFYHCQNLTNIIIPNSVTNMDWVAFAFCGSLVNATVGSGITKLPPGMFGCDSNLVSVTLSPNVTEFELNEPGRGTFELCTALKNITLPYSLTNIGHHAFGESGLTNITIPDQVRYIGYASFSECLNLASVTVGSNVTAIEASAFVQCPNLTRVYFTGNAPSARVDPGTFAEVFQNSPVTVYYRLGTSNWGPTLGGAPTVALDPSANPQFQVSLANGVVTIIGYVGPGGAVNIPGSIAGYPVTSIGSAAFSNAPVTSVTIPNSVTSIGFRAFYGCASLASVNIGQNVGSITIGAFQNCSALTSLTVPNRVSFIGNVAFAGCTSLTNVVLGSGLTILDTSAFSSCPALAGSYFKGAAPSTFDGGGFSGSTTVYYPMGSSAASFTSAFPGLPIQPWDPVLNLRLALAGGSLTVNGYVGGVGGVYRQLYIAGNYLDLPSTIGGYPVTGIGANAFAGNGLTGVIIPETVTNLGANAFANATELGYIFFKGGAPTLGAGVFTGTPATIHYQQGFLGWGAPGATFGGRPTAFWSPQVPCTLTTAGVLGVGYYIGVGGAVEIPSGVGGLGSITTIGSHAFDGCPITSIIIPAGVTNLEAFSFAHTIPLTRAYFKGNAPTVTGLDFDHSSAVIYYDLGTTGWGAMGAPFDGRPTGLWSAQVPARITLLSGAFKIDQYLGSGGFVTIPSAIGGYPVTRIGTSAFYGSAINSVTIPNSVTEIWDYAFYGCTNLLSTTLGNGVTSIGAFAFAACPQSTITLPASLTFLDDFAFAQCGPLYRVYFDGNAPVLGGNHVFIGTPAIVFHPFGATGWDSYDNTFSKRPAYFWSQTWPYGFTMDTNGSLTIEHFRGAGGAVPLSIPASVNGYPVRSIGQGALSPTPTTAFTIPDSVTNIAGGAFSSSYNLRSVTFGNGVSSIGSYAFADCPLTNITLPASLTSLYPFAFSYCASLTNIFFEGNAPALPNYDPVSFPQLFLGSYPALYYEPGKSGWGSIGAPFGGFPTALWSTQVPSKLTLTNGVLTVGQYVGSGGPANVPSAIGGYPVTSIQTLSFVYSPISSLTIPDSVQKIEDYCFYGSTNLTSVTLGNGVTNIGQYTFAYCAALNSISIGNSVKTIAASAFTGCSALTTITIPASVTSVGDLSFYNCGSLQSVFFKGNAPALGGGFVFDSTPATLYYLSGATGWGPTFAGRPAFLWNPLLQASGSGLGVQGNQFIFRITGGTNLPIAVEACTNLASPVWQRLQTGTLTNGSVQFNDPVSPAIPKRFYRVSAP